MTWQVETIVSIETGNSLGYTVRNQIGGDSNLPIDLVFPNREDAIALAKWLQRREDWTDRLEHIVEYETDVNLEELKRKQELNNG